jgi:predicted transcriptional regulator
MQNPIKILSRISSKYAPSRNLSFGIAHIFKTLQLASAYGHISRSLLCKELNLGEGSVKTLIKHLKMNEMIITSQLGTILTNKGKFILRDLLTLIPSETIIPKSSITLGKFNYCVLLKNSAKLIGSGLEQRDEAIKLGATGATTLIFSNGKFFIPETEYDALNKENIIRNLLIQKLKPKDNDVIIIGSDDNSNNTAELATKGAALFTMISPRYH